MNSNGIFSGLLYAIDDIIYWIESTAEQVHDIFADVDFTILYDWLPSDIVSVITAVIAVLLALALFGLVRRVLFWLG